MDEPQVCEVCGQPAGDMGLITVSGMVRLRAGAGIEHVSMQVCQTCAHYDMDTAGFHQIFEGWAMARQARRMVEQGAARIKTEAERNDPANVMMEIAEEWGNDLKGLVEYHSEKAKEFTALWEALHVAERNKVRKGRSDLQKQVGIAHEKMETAAERVRVASNIHRVILYALNAIQDLQRQVEEGKQQWA